MSSSDPQTRFGVVLFHSVHGALSAEKLVVGAGLTHQLIPVPRHLSSNCGFCLRFDWADRELIQKLLPGDKLGVEGIVAL